MNNKIWRDRFEQYKRAYAKRERYLKNRGAEMFLPQMNFAEFKGQYIAVENSLVLDPNFSIDVLPGTAETSPKNIIGSMVEEASYALSLEQAERIKDYAAKITGQENLTVAQIRSGKFNWEVIEERRKELMNKYSHLAPTDRQAIIKLTIGKEFFGSL